MQPSEEMIPGTFYVARLSGPGLNTYVFEFFSPGPPRRRFRIELDAEAFGRAITASVIDATLSIRTFADQKKPRDAAEGV